MKQFILLIFTISLFTSFGQFNSRFYLTPSYVMPLGQLKSPIRNATDVLRGHGGLTHGVGVDMGGRVYPNTFLNEIVTKGKVKFGFDIAASFTYIFGQSARPSSIYTVYAMGYEETYELSTYDKMKNNMMFIGGQLGPSIGFQLARNIQLDIFYRLNPSAVNFNTQHVEPIEGAPTYGFLTNTEHCHFDFIMRQAVGMNIRFGFFGMGIDYRFGNFGGMFLNYLPSEQIPMNTLNFRISFF